LTPIDVTSGNPIERHLSALYQISGWRGGASPNPRQHANRDRHHQGRQLYGERTTAEITSDTVGSPNTTAMNVVLGYLALT
jgi:hypothetical protein